MEKVIDVKKRPGDIVDLAEFVPELLLDLPYRTERNFVGSPIDGYDADKLLCSRAAALSIQTVQTSLAREGLGLKVFDCYRPQRAVEHFIAWANDEFDQRTKAEYYPHLTKSQLIPLGYLMPLSAHSRCSTIDLTLIESETKAELDMGSRFDFFDPLSWPASKKVSAEQRSRRMKLRQAMLTQGFLPLETEWWHFTLQNEPYPSTYFDFPIV